MAEIKKIKIKMSKTYKVGNCGIESKVGKELGEKFEEGKEISVTPKQHASISKHGWCDPPYKEIKGGKDG